MRSALMLTCAAAALLTACTPPTQYPNARKEQAPQPPVQRARQTYLNQNAGEPITCTNGADCDEKWAHALIWVNAHSQYSVKVHTDSEIITNGPIPPTTDAAFSITRAPGDAGTMIIHFSANCGENTACVPTVLELNTEFRTYLLNGSMLGDF